MSLLFPVILGSVRTDHQGRKVARSAISTSCHRHYTTKR